MKLIVFRANKCGRGFILMATIICKYFCNIQKFRGFDYFDEIWGGDYMHNYKYKEIEY